MHIHRLYTPLALRFFTLLAPFLRQIQHRIRILPHNRLLPGSPAKATQRLLCDSWRGDQDDRQRLVRDGIGRVRRSEGFEEEFEIGAVGFQVAVLFPSFAGEDGVVGTCGSACLPSCYTS